VTDDTRLSKPVRKLRTLSRKLDSDRASTGSRSEEVLQPSKPRAFDEADFPTSILKDHRRPCKRAKLRPSMDADQVDYGRHAECP
jgi:hypothetical protein